MSLCMASNFHVGEILQTLVELSKVELESVEVQNKRRCVDLIYRITYLSRWSIHSRNEMLILE